MLVPARGSTRQAHWYLGNSICCFLQRHHFLVATQYHSHYRIRGLVIIHGLIVSMVAAVFLYIMLLGVLHARIGALYINFPHNTAGYTKRAILSALCFIANCVSNIIDPQFFKAKQARLYPLDGRHSRKQHPEYLDIVLCITSYLKESRKRETAAAAIRGDSQEAHFDTDFRDLTNMQNPRIRYVW